MMRPRPRLQHALRTAHYSLPTTHYELLATHYSLLTTHYSLLTTHYSLLTTHYSLLTRFTTCSSPQLYPTTCSPRTTYYGEVKYEHPGATSYEVKAVIGQRWRALAEGSATTARRQPPYPFLPPRPAAPSPEPLVWPSCSLHPVRPAPAASPALAF